MTPKWRHSFIMASNRRVYCIITGILAIKSYGQVVIPIR